MRAGLEDADISELAALPGAHNRVAKHIRAQQVDSKNS